jgi:hypothetical protein
VAAGRGEESRCFSNKGWKRLDLGGIDIYNLMLEDQCHKY